MDQYLSVSKYEGHPKSPNNPEFTTFKHDGNFYFAMLDKNGKVVLRSEGYSSEAGRDNGIVSVTKNRGNNERWSISSIAGMHYLILKAGNNQEIGRSGSFRSEADAKAALAFITGSGPAKSSSSTSAGSAASAGTSAGYAAALAASGIVPGRIISEKRGKVINETRNQIGESRKEIGVTRNIIGENRKQISEAKNLKNTLRSEVEYLPCAAYHGHKVTDSKNNVAVFEKGKKHYFAVYNKGGAVRLRGAGYNTAARRDEVLSDVLANHSNNKLFTTIRKDNYTMDSLRNKDGREIARTCAKGEALIAPAAAVASMAALPAEEPMAELTAPAGLGFLPFLPLLLLFLIPFCAAPDIVPPIPPPPVPFVAPVVAAPITCDCSKLTHPIFKIPDGPPPKATTVLGRAPEYGNSHDLSPKEFYNKLKNKYAASGMERRFLDGIFKQMGYENGFKDATAELFSNVEIPRGVDGNLGTKTNHQTVYRKLNTNKRDRQAFKIVAKNACHFHFMKTCGNHFFYKDICDNN